MKNSRFSQPLFYPKKIAGRTHGRNVDLHPLEDCLRLEKNFHLPHTETSSWQMRNLHSAIFLFKNFWGGCTVVKMNKQPARMDQSRVNQSCFIQCYLILGELRMHLCSWLLKCLWLLDSPFYAMFINRCRSQATRLSFPSKSVALLFFNAMWLT